MSRELYSEIDNLLSDKEIKSRHSMFQLEYWVVGNEVNTQAKLRRCLVELDGRRETIEQYRLGIAEASDDVELYDISIEKLDRETPATELDNKAKKIQIRKLDRKRAALVDSLASLERKIREAEEEAEFFLRAFQALEKEEALKPFDDLATNAAIWNEKLTREIRLQLMLRKPIDVETVKTILSLPNETPIKNEVTGMLKQLEDQALEMKAKLLEENGG